MEESIRYIINSLNQIDQIDQSQNIRKHIEGLGCYLLYDHASESTPNRIISRNEFFSLDPQRQKAAIPILPGDILVNWGAFGIPFINHYALYVGSIDPSVCGKLIEIESNINTNSPWSILLSLWSILTRGHTPGKIESGRDASELAWNYSGDGHTRRPVAKYNSPLKYPISKRTRRLRNALRTLKMAQWKYDFIMYNCKYYVHTLDNANEQEG